MDDAWTRDYTAQHSGRPERYAQRAFATMISRIGAAFAVAALGLATPSAWAAPAAGKGPSAPSATSGRGPTTDGRSDTGSASPAPQISQDAAARARMHECAHQWSAIKKAGNAGATTWKEFSATCLVVSR